MIFKTFALSDIGKIREKNEDAHLECPINNGGRKDALIMVVADGMGGHRAGDVASNKVIETFRKNIESDNYSSHESLLKNSILQANSKILELSDAEEKMRGMGTTCTAMILADGKSTVAHVGDSRAYLIRKDSLKQLTQDHTVAEHMVTFGMMTQEEARSSPKRNILMRALGINRDLEVDIVPPIKIQSEDIFMLCSDGLAEYLKEDEIIRIVSSLEPKEACIRLVEMANERGGKDNITVVLTKAHSDKGGFFSGIKSRILN